MKKTISILLTLVMLFALAACGTEEVQPEVQPPVENAEDVESTLSPREQFQQISQAMDALHEGNAEEKKQEDKEEVKEEVADTAAPVTYTTNGLTYTLDGSFKSAGEAADSAQHKYTSDTMWITVQIFGNSFGYKSSQELAEYIASQKESRVVGSRNGVYYVEELSAKTVKAYYVDDSGYYWIISGFVTGGSDYAVYGNALVDFCTSGKIN